MLLASSPGVIMDLESQRKWGRVAGALGLLILTLNIIDFLAGWNKVADETMLLGAALALAGAYYALKKEKKHDIL